MRAARRLALFILFTAMPIFGHARVDQDAVAGKIRNLIAQYHGLGCADNLMSSWNREDFSTVETDELRPYLEHRAQVLRLPLPEYIEIIAAPEGTYDRLSIFNEEQNYLKSLLSAASLGALDLSMPVDFAEPQFQNFQNEFLNLLKSSFKTESAVQYFRVFGLGKDFVELDAIVGLIHEQARRLRLSEEQLCKKLNLRFGFYDMRPSVLNKAREKMKQMGQIHSWLANRTEIRFMNFIEPSMYSHMEDQSTLLFITRNTFRENILRRGSELLTQFRRLSTVNGWFITDGSAATAMQESEGHSMRNIMQIESNHYGPRANDYVISVWK